MAQHDPKDWFECCRCAVKQPVVHLQRGPTYEEPPGWTHTMAWVCKDEKRCARWAKQIKKEMSK